MARFQALTNAVLDDELEMLRQRLGLLPSQKAELLREVAALAAWVVRQAQVGRAIEARRGRDVEPLVHPALDRLRAAHERPMAERVALTEEESGRLAEILDRGFEPPPALRAALAHLSEERRQPPKVRWKPTAA